MKGTFFENLQIELPEECVSTGGCWQHAGDGTAQAWGAPELKHFYDLLRSVENPVFLDIGANTGSVALLSHLIPGSACTAFEPNPKVCDVLRKAVAINNAPVVCVQAALGQQDGWADLFVPVGDQSGLARIGHGAGLGSTSVFRVPQYCLDSSVVAHSTTYRRIDFISLDVEGREMDVLLGASKTLAMWHPGIQIEWVEEHARQCGHTLTQVHELLTLLGYDKYKTLSDTDRYYWKS